MRKFLFGLIVGLAIPALAAYSYFRYGYAPVATSSNPMPFEAKLAHMALKARIETEAPRTEAPIEASEANLVQGAAIYKENCAFCHGILNQKATAAAKGMFPLPPQLLNKDEMVTNDPVGETYWKVANGIRMTGMPGFGELLTKDQVWKVSLLLKNAGKLPPQVQLILTKTAEEKPNPTRVRPQKKESKPQKKN